jgi:RNA polymerase sigma-70 factor (ECF subfamily)
MKSDSEIVQSVLKGNRAAYAELVRRYEGAVRAVAFQRLGNLHAAEDIAQEAFIKAYTSLHSLRDGTAFGTWLLQITRRRAVDVLRKNKHTLPLDEEIPCRGPGPDHHVRLDEESAALLEAVMKLPEHEQNVVLLRYFDDQPVRQIAEITGRSVGTVTKQLTRAHTRLRTQLKEHVR